MSDLVALQERPVAKEIYMIAGWRQWADAGSISSALPEYIVQQTEARKIGELKPNGYYLFQVPGTHHFLRPIIKLKDGYREALDRPQNEIFYAGNEDRGLVIFLGDEPHLNVERYAEAFFEVATALGVKRVAAVGGVYGATPYDRDRQVSCVYSLKRMREELENYGVNFSNYEGGATIGSYLLDRAERQEREFVAFYAFVPAYDFSQSELEPQGIRIEHDYKAWYDLMRRFNQMFGINYDLSELEEQSLALEEALDGKIADLEMKLGGTAVQDYLAEVDAQFKENPFLPLDDVWGQELDDIFDDLDESP